MFDIVWYDYSDGDIESLITKAKQGSKTEYVWLANRDVDYSKFNFRWMPNRHQLQYKHAWPSHKNAQHYSTWLIPVDNDNGTVHHDEILSASDNKYYDTCLLNTNSFDNAHSVDFQVRLITTMQAAIDSAVNKCTKPWLWIIADCCDYNGFDFSWLPSNHDMNYIHCWPSGTCEKGDTFLINADAYKRGEQNYNFDHEPVKRKRWSNIKITQDSLARELNLTNRLNAIYTVYSHIGFVDYPDICLWDKRPVVSINKNNSTTLVPRDCIVKDELYEYPHLLRYPQYGFDALNDIIFISYDEPEADTNWYKLLDKFPRAKRVHGVSGMENALKAAASASDTPYFYAVFAKTEIHPTFNFDIGADYWQKPKHYIFYSENTVNGLRYGHMGIVLYNRDMVLNAPPFGEFGTDYTLSFDHEVVPIVSCYGSFNASPYHTWRTAFREAHKLREFTDTMPNVETQYRLHIWRTIANGNHAEWALRGANDGVRFYEDNMDTPEVRRNTFRWEWLRNHFTQLYGDVQ